jgi:hypothetical protein
LRDYEARRRSRAAFVIRQFWRMGTVLQLYPLAVWLREILGSTSWAHKQSERLFKRLLRVDLPDLPMVAASQPG